MHHQQRTLDTIYQSLTSRFERLFLILAPPRTASTAMARVFWEYPPIRFYVHEPFDRTYYPYSDGHFDKVVDVTERITQSIDLVQSDIKANAWASPHRWVCIKEMTFQIGKQFLPFAQIISTPVIILIRDPRLSIYSRMQMRIQGNQTPQFPVVETGWIDLNEQLTLCKQEDLPYLIIDATDLRKNPNVILTSAFSHFAYLGYDFSPEMLRWKSLSPHQIRLGGLEGDQDHWYTRTLSSTGIEPPIEEIPSIDVFPAEDGFRNHVNDALDIYSLARSDSNLVEG